MRTRSRGRRTCTRRTSSRMGRSACFRFRRNSTSDTRDRRGGSVGIPVSCGSTSGSSTWEHGAVATGRIPEEARGKTGRPTETRNKPERPRDRLGRPQPWDAENELELEDFDHLSPEENHRLGRAHFAAARYFPAHEAWETAWKQSRDTDDAEFFKGLSQLGAGYTHLLRGNAHGAIRLLTRGSGRLRRYPSMHRGIRTTDVADRADALAAAIDRGDVVPGEAAAFEQPV